LGLIYLFGLSFGCGRRPTATGEITGRGVALGSSRWCGFVFFLFFCGLCFGGAAACGRSSAVMLGHGGHAGKLPARHAVGRAGVGESPRVALGARAGRRARFKIDRRFVHAMTKGVCFFFVFFVVFCCLLAGAWWSLCCSAASRYSEKTGSAV